MAGTMLKDHVRHMILDEEQFAKIVELLTPGYECSKIMLAQLQAQQPQPDQPPDDAEHED